MPIYDYRCADCGTQFESLVMRGREPTACPSCASSAIARQVSLPAITSEATRGLAMQAARRRDVAQAKDKAHEQRKYERSHND